MSSIGMPEMIVIGLVIVVLFGSKKIPDLARGLGEGIRNFKTSMKDEAAELKEVQKEVEKV